MRFSLAEGWLIILHIHVVILISGFIFVHLLRVVMILYHGTKSHQHDKNTKSREACSETKISLIGHIK